MKVLERWRENEAKPPLERHFGYSLPFLPTTARREKGLLVDVATTDGIEPTEPAPALNGTLDV